jgi:lysozyme
MLYHRVQGYSVDMELSAAGLELLKRSEGFVGHTYKDVAGFPTIGYGHRLRKGEWFPDGITEPEAVLLMRGDLAEVYAAIERLVKVPLTQGQFDALVDFTYNLGVGRLAASTMLKELNAGHFQSAAEQLLRWDIADGKENAGLKRRREAEYKLWIAPTPKDRPAPEDL